MKSASLSTFGAKFVVEPEGTKLSDKEKRLLQELKPSGIMFRKRNFLTGSDYETWLSAYSSLLNQCKEAIGADKLIICVDHEGGRVIRPPLPITPFPYAAHWADQVVSVASAMAIELKSLGINVDFAPVADIHSNPENPVINERAFAQTAEKVARACTKFASALMSGGIVPCAKHFPGHGDTKQDSHYGLPVVESTLDELRKRELIPFQALIDMGIPLIMTAHIVFPKVDPDNQATISKKILNDLLRNEMHFKGVIIADALGMKSISGELKAYETTVIALNASLDLFLVAGDNADLDTALTIAKQMQAAVASGDVSEETVQTSLDRIANVLQSLPQYKVEQLDQRIFDQHAALARQLCERKPASGFELHVPGFD